jgi:hypothetical protein
MIKRNLSTIIIGGICVILASAVSGFAAATIGSAQIKTDSIQNVDIHSGAVRNSELYAGSVSWGKLNDDIKEMLLTPEVFATGLIDPGGPEPSNLLVGPNSANYLGATMTAVRTSQGVYTVTIAGLTVNYNAMVSLDSGPTDAHRASTSVTANTLTIRVYDKDDNPVDPTYINFAVL